MEILGVQTWFSVYRIWLVKRNISIFFSFGLIRLSLLGMLLMVNRLSAFDCGHSGLIPGLAESSFNIFNGFSTVLFNLLSANSTHYLKLAYHTI